MDKDSRLIWKYLANAHHDLDVGPDGNIYLLTHEIRNTIIDQWRHLKPPRIDDFVVVLSPDGQELKKVSVLDALVASPYARLLNTVAWYSKDDYTHANSVELVDESAAMRLSGKPGRQVLVSMRELGAIGLLDLDREVSPGRCAGLGSVSMIPICCRTATCCCSTTSVTSAIRPLAR